MKVRSRVRKPPTGVYRVGPARHLVTILEKNLGLHYVVRFEDGTTRRVLKDRVDLVETAR